MVNHSQAVIALTKETAASHGNPCVCCTENLFNAILSKNFASLPVCRFPVNPYKGVFSRQAYIKLGLIEYEDKEALAKCVRCNEGGRHCHQLPYDAYKIVKEKIMAVIAPDSVTSDTVNASRLEDSLKKSLSLSAVEASTALVSACGSKYAGNPVTPLHSGEAEHLDTGVVLPVKNTVSQIKASNRLGDDGPGLPSPVRPARSRPTSARRGESGDSTRIDKLETEVAELRELVTILREDVSKNLKTKRGDNVRAAFKAVDDKYGRSAE